MDFLNQLFSDGREFIVSAGLFVLIIVVLSIIRKLLERNSKKVAGRRFRNQLVMFGLSLIGLLMIILILPVDSATKGNLLSLVGLVLSATIALSSTTFLGNAMAGIMLKSLRNFRSGDFVRTAEHFGRVTERGLFHTEIQTLDRDLTTLPNLLLANQAVTVIRQSGTIVSATASLGYDVPRTRIETCLLEAATQTGLKDPFVQVLELGDFSVTYRVAGLLTEAKQLIRYRSRLRAAMLDALHGAGIEIVSPAFINARNFTPQDGFIPGPAVVVQDVPDAAPVEVVFDKAEVAESLSIDSQQIVDLQTELKAVEQQLKDAPDESTKEQLTRGAEHLRSQIEELEQRLAAHTDEGDLGNI